MNRYSQLSWSWASGECIGASPRGHCSTLQTILAPARMLSKPTQDLRTSQTQGQPVLVTEFGHIHLLAAKWKQCGNYGTSPIAPKALPTLEQCSKHNYSAGCYQLLFRLGFVFFNWRYFYCCACCYSSQEKITQVSVLWITWYSDRRRCVLWLSWWWF